MAINPESVHLIAGQSMRAVDGGVMRLSPEIEHNVVIADSGPLAYAFLTARKPLFKIVGSSTLADHQAAIAKIESAFRGEDSELEVHFATPAGEPVAV